MVTKWLIRTPMHRGLRRPNRSVVVECAMGGGAWERCMGDELRLVLSSERSPMHPTG
jgi:hypothetical protein